MKIKSGMLFVLAAAALAAAFPLAASAQDGRASKWVNLRAGPARDYPLVARLGPGSPLAVQGCTDGYGWCDVIGPGDTRGWIYAANIDYPYQNQNVPVIGYGAAIGIPVVTFVIGSYWGSYYRNRPWYGNQPHWAHRPPPPRPNWRPHGPPPRPVMRPPGPQRPPGGRPPGDQRPPPGGRPPDGNRPPGQRPPPVMRPNPGPRPPPVARPNPGQPPQGARPPGGRPPGAQQPGSGAGRPAGGMQRPGPSERPPGGGGGGRPGGGQGRPEGGGPRP